MIIKKDPNDPEVGNLVVTGEDKVGRADAKLVSILTKISRELKGKGVESLYHYEDVYKRDTTVLKFNWDNRDVVARIVRQNAYAVQINE